MRYRGFDIAVLNLRTFCSAPESLITAAMFRVSITQVQIHQLIRLILNSKLHVCAKLLCAEIASIPVSVMPTRTVGGGREKTRLQR
jgi:hypothetical protein